MYLSHWQVIFLPTNDSSLSMSAVAAWSSRKSTVEILYAWTLGTAKEFTGSHGCIDELSMW